ncbi:MAG: amidohydrolase family protein, partial [Planctomycetota bacterium]
MIAVTAAIAQPPAQFSSAVTPYIRATAKRIVLTHVRVIDGTGKPEVDDQNVTIEGGKITAIAKGADVASAPGTTVLDMQGRTLLPGLVAMHEHMYYIARPATAAGKVEDPLLVPQMTFSAPRLYLAAGVTTVRTGGSVEGQSDINLRDQIDAGKLIGPHMEVTAPYLQGKGGSFIQMYQLKDADDARRFVNFWADAGATSFKAYMHITRDELGAAIDAAHKRGLKVTGHLCSITYSEAIALGIDNLEHGFMVNTDLAPSKQPDVCPMGDTSAFLEHADPNGPEAKALIEDLVKHHVAITSTLPVFEGFTPNRPPLYPRAQEVLSPEARTAYLYSYNRTQKQPAQAAAKRTTIFARGMAMELAFAKAGGLLTAGCDPTGNGGVVPGFSDHREIELLVEAGFTPVEAIKIATLNGAVYLGRDKTIGSIEIGKNADLFIVNGNPGKNINDIQNVELVIKDGVAYEPQKLLDSVKGRYGQY